MNARSLISGSFFFFKRNLKIVKKPVDKFILKAYNRQCKDRTTNDRPTKQGGHENDEGYEIHF